MTAMIRSTFGGPLAFTTSAISWKYLGPSARGDHAEFPRVLGVKVREVMHAPARDKEDVARSDTDLPVVKHPGQDARQPVDRLIEGLVAMRDRHAGLCGDEKLKHRQASRGLRSLQKESDLDLTRVDHGVSSSRICHGVPCVIQWSCVFVDAPNEPLLGDHGIRSCFLATRCASE